MPIVIEGTSVVRNYAIPHCLRMVDCLDETQSDILKWPSDAGERSANHRYRMVTNLAIDRRKVPASAHFFRIQRWPIALIVSELVKDAMQRKGCLGAKFEQVD